MFLLCAVLILSHRQAAWASTDTTLFLLIIHYQSPSTPNAIKSEPFSPKFQCNYISCAVGQVKSSSFTSTCPGQALMSSSVTVYKSQASRASESDCVTRHSWIHPHLAGWRVLISSPVCTYTSVTFIITIPCLQFTHAFEDETSHGARCILGNSIPCSVFRCIHQISANVAGNPGTPCIQKIHILFIIYT